MKGIWKYFKNLYLYAIIVFVFVVLFFVAQYIIFMMTIDVESIKKLNSALQTYDIEALDDCLSQNAEIVYKNNTYLYKDCREKILEKMKNKSYEISMYGGGDNIFKNGVQEIGTQVYGDINDVDYNESHFNIYLEKKTSREFEIIKIESNDEILMKLFIE